MCLLFANMKLKTFGGYCCFRWSTHTGGTEMLFHSTEGVVFAAPPLDAARVVDLPVLVCTAADDNVVPTAVTDLCANTLHQFGAHVTLKRFSASCLHTRTATQWHTVGQWLTTTIGLPQPPLPLTWQQERVDLVELPERTLSAHLRADVARLGARALINSLGEVLNQTLENLL